MLGQSLEERGESVLSRLACWGLGLGLAVTLAAGAQAPAFDLNQACREALETSPVVQQFRSRSREARFAVDEAYTAAYPTLSLSAGYLRQTPTITLQQGRTAVPVTVTDNYNSTVSLRQAIYTFGRLHWSAANAELLERSAKAQQAGEEATVLEDARVAYYGALLGRERLGIARDDLAARQAHLDDARNLLKSGVVARFDVLRDEAAFSAAQQALLEAQVQSEVALRQLFSQMGRPFQPGQEAALAPVSGADDPAPADLEASRRQALERRPDLAALSFAAEAGRARVQLAAAQDNPGLNFQSDYQLRTATVFQPSQLWTFGVVFSIPLYDGGLSEARSNEAREAVVQLEAILADARRQALVEVDSLFMELGSRRERIQVSLKTLESAQEAARVARLRYEGGISANVELLDAEAELTRARLQVAQARSDYLIGWAHWRRAVPAEEALQ